MKTEFASLGEEKIDCNSSSIISRSEGIRCDNRRVRLLQRDKLLRFSLPAAVHLVSKFFKPTWYIGFCSNGRAFANSRPYMATCPNYHLTMRWNLLYICPPIPRECRILECNLTDWRLLTQISRCPRACQLSIQCGNIRNVFPSVEH